MDREAMRSESVSSNQTTERMMDLVEKIQQLTLVNSHLQQQLNVNQNTISSLELTFTSTQPTHQQPISKKDLWSQSSSTRSSRSSHGEPIITNTVIKRQGARDDPASVLHQSKQSGSRHEVTGERNSRESLRSCGGKKMIDRSNSGEITNTRTGLHDRSTGGSTGSVNRLEHDSKSAHVATITPFVTNEDRFKRLPSCEDLVEILHTEGRLVELTTQTIEVFQSPVHQTSSSSTRREGKGVLPKHLSTLYHGAWNLGESETVGGHDTQSVMSFHSSISSHSSRPSHRHRAHQHTVHSHKHQSDPLSLIEAKTDYPLLSMLGTHEPDDISQTLLAMSSYPDSCEAMRQSGCIPLLLQLIYGSDNERDTVSVHGGAVCRAQACKALHNIVHSVPEDKKNRRETKILKYLEVIQARCESIRQDEQTAPDSIAYAQTIWPPADLDRDPGPSVAALMKLSFDDHCRQLICTLGGLQCISGMLKFDTLMYYDSSHDVQRLTMRRYACMTLTNLTFGDSNNKARICSMNGVLNAIVTQLQVYDEDLCQVAASVIRNLSWRADDLSKRHLLLSQAATKLMKVALQVKNESTLKSILSALWNLSAHCTQNKTSICEVKGSIDFLVSMLNYVSASKTVAIIECAGGILRNISSVIAMRDDYRQILRNRDALKTLLTHLRSPSLPIVGNACGALWNISARSSRDQKTLIELDAIAMLKNLVTSRHRLIAMGSSATIKNLRSYKKLTGGTSYDGSRGKKTRREDLEQRIVTGSGRSHDSNERIERSYSDDSVGSCSSLLGHEITSYEQTEHGQSSLNQHKIEQIMQEVIQTNLEIHQLRKVSSGTAAGSDGSKSAAGSNNSTPLLPRSKLNGLSMTSSNNSMNCGMVRSTDLQSNRTAQVLHNALSPRVTQKSSGQPGVDNSGSSYPALLSLNQQSSINQSSDLSDIDSKTGTTTATNYKMTYNDDHIDDNVSEKPVDYSKIYNQEIYGRSDMTDEVSADIYNMDMYMSNTSTQHQSDNYHQMSDNRYNMFDYNIPSLNELKAQAYQDFSTDPNLLTQTSHNHMYRPANNHNVPQSHQHRVMPNLNKIEDTHQIEDQITTFCTEGTPMNFLSTATSMNELHKIGADISDETSSNKSQPTFKKEPTSNPANKLTTGRDMTAINEQRLLNQTVTREGTTQSYNTENTAPNIDQKPHFNNRLSGAKPAQIKLDESDIASDNSPHSGLPRIQEDEVLSSVQARTTNPAFPKTPTEHKTVSFDEHAHVQETPMMFSRASSLASLSSFDQHSVHSSVFSDYSRRASQVVSPSDLPDSPGATTPSSPKSGRKNNTSQKHHRAPPKTRTEASTPPLPPQTNDNIPSEGFQPLTSMFGSLSALASMQGVDNSENEPSQPQQVNNQPYTQIQELLRPVPQHPLVQPYTQQSQPPQAIHGGVHMPRPVVQSPNSNLHSMSISAVTQILPNSIPMGEQAFPQQASSLPSITQPKETPHFLSTNDTTVTRSESEPLNLTRKLPETSQQTGQCSSLRALSKVDQFLTDTVRTYAVEGTPGPNSSRSSLSALTFLDEPGEPFLLNKDNPLLKSNTSLSSQKLKTVIESPTKSQPLDLTTNKTKSKPLNLIKSKPQTGATESKPPPLPPRKSHLYAGLKKSSTSPSNSVKDSPSKDGHKKQEVDSDIPTSQPADDVMDQRPDVTAQPLDLPVQQSVEVSESAGLEDCSDDERDEMTERKDFTRRSSVRDTESSSEGDDDMLQQCISSAMPISKKFSKSSSDGAVSSKLPKPVSRSKTFGSKLRMPSKKIIRNQQLAKRAHQSTVNRTAIPPPIVSANSPTPDDDYFAEDTVQSYCTEDTPYNKSTATSLSDLSVNDDDDSPPTLEEICDVKRSADKKSTDELSDVGSLSSDSESESPAMFLDRIVSSAVPKPKAVQPPTQTQNAVKPRTVIPVSTQLVSNTNAYQSMPRTETPGAASVKPAAVKILPMTGNELRAVDVKFNQSADSVRNYATEGTPHNFSTNTSLSDLTLDSHYTGNLTGQSQTGANKSSQPHPVSSQTIQSQPTSSQTNQSNAFPQTPSSQHLLNKRQQMYSPRVSTPSTAWSTSTPTSRKLPQVTVQPQKLQAETSDEMKSFGVEDTPYSFSRRDSLSSLSCDSSSEDDQANITIINRVNDAMIKRMQQQNASPSSKNQIKNNNMGQTTQTTGHQPTTVQQPSIGQQQTTGQQPTTNQQPRINQQPTTDLQPPKSGGAGLRAEEMEKEVTFRNCRAITRQMGQAAELHSQDEVSKFTPIEGTPYNFSRNSPLSSLTSDDDEDTQPAGILESHKAETIGDSASDSDSDSSRESLASSHAFLANCITSALPKKTSNSTNVPRTPAGSTRDTSMASPAPSDRSATDRQAVRQELKMVESLPPRKVGSQIAVVVPNNRSQIPTAVATRYRTSSNKDVASVSPRVAQPCKQPPPILPKPKKNNRPPSVTLLPDSTELHISQRISPHNSTHSTRHKTSSHEAEINDTKTDISQSSKLN